MSKLLALQLLGPFSATYLGAPLSHFRTKTVQALLIYLTCQPEAHRRESLMALLWPGATRTSAQNSLRQALYHLRQAVPEVSTPESAGSVPLVLSDRQMVWVNPQASFELDVAIFEERLQRPQAQWHEAVGLYRGDFLCDFYLPDSADFEDWVLLRRADLHRQAMDALDLLVAAQMEQGLYESAEELVRRQLAIDSLHELAHRRLMEILVHRGRRNQALSHYETYVRLLHEELGVGPAEESVRLIEQVRDGAPAASAPSPPVHAVRPPQKHNLQPQPFPLIGRRQELDELSALMAGPYRRLITIVGPGGIGKTRLALAFARSQLDEKDGAGLPRLPDGVFFVPLQPVRNRDQIIAAVAKALGLRLKGTRPRWLQQQILDFLREKQLLLILDSFEHLLDEAALVAELLASAPGLRLLVTSRERLALYGEQAYPLLGLAFPLETATLERGEVIGYPSVALFLERARRTLPAYRPSADDEYQILDLCRLVSRVPLAIELAASWIDVRPAARIVAEVRQNLDCLTAEIRDMPARHRSMRAVFDSTWSRLTVAEQDTLAQLSVFHGEFSAAAAKSVARAGQLTLTRLAHKSVLQTNTQTHCYHLHELLRQYCECRLSEQECAASDEPLERLARERHCVYYCNALGKWEKGLKSERQREVLAEIGTEWDNVRAAWEEAVINCRTNLLGQASESLAVYIASQGHHQLGKTLFSTAAQAVREISARAAKPGETLVYARLLIWHAYFCDYYEDQCLREELAEESLAILEDLQARDIDTRLERAKVWQLISINYRNSWDHDEALQAARNSLALSRAVGADWSVADVLEALGRSAIYSRRYQEAKDWLESCLALQRKLGNRAGEARALRRLATLAGSNGQWARDEHLMRACLAIHEELGNEPAAAQTTGIIAIDLHAQGRFREAVIVFTEAISRSRHLGMNTQVAYQLGALAGAKESLGHYDEAVSLAEEALALIRGQSVTLVRTLGLRVLSTVALVQKRYGDASNLLQERQQMLEGSPLGQQVGLACQSYLATANEDYALSARALQAALRGTDQAAASLLWTLPAGALLLARLGAIRAALAIYAAATHQPYVGNSRWFDDVVGAPLREIARTLPPRSVQEAEEQGRPLDIWQAGHILLEELEAYLDDCPPTGSYEVASRPFPPE